MSRWMPFLGRIPPRASSESVVRLLVLDLNLIEAWSVVLPLVLGTGSFIHYILEYSEISSYIGRFVSVINK